jgi:hypothetical protein
MLDADPDGDGASNRDEFMADTNPRDPNSRPGVHPFMRLKEFHEVQVPLLLESVEGETARIKHLDGPDGKTESVREGQTINGMKVRRVQVRKETEKHGEPVDLSRVELDDPQSKEKIVLVKDLPTRSASSSAVLASPDRQTTVTVKQGETFVWPSEPNVSYKVIDLRPEQAVIQQIDTKKMFTIPAQYRGRVSFALGISPLRFVGPVRRVRPVRPPTASPCTKQLFREAAALQKAAALAFKLPLEQISGCS